MEYKLSDGDVEFERNKDGSISLGVDIWGSTIISAEEWISLVTAMSLNKSSTTHKLIKKLHMKKK